MASTSAPTRSALDNSPLPSLAVPFVSLTLKDTTNYALSLASLVVLTLKTKPMSRVIITLESFRGGGKTTCVTAVLMHLSAMVSEVNSAAVSFVAVREYLFRIDGKKIRVAHVDPDYKGHQHLPSLHSSPDWNVLFFEHGSHPAFNQYKDQLEMLGFQNYVHYNIDISNDDVRIFTMSSPSGDSLVTPAPFSWVGHLVDLQTSPDTRLTVKQAHNLRSEELVTLAIDTSCDDTCCTIVKLKGDNIQVRWNFKKQCVQQMQQKGKEGIDPRATALKHADNLALAEQELRKILLDHNIKIDLVAVTQGPGQPFALLEGIAFAQKIAVGFSCPIMYLDHVRGHAISSLLSTDAPVAPDFPIVVAVISGGHSVYLLMESAVKMRILFTPPNDAIGEVIDKICRAMGISAVPPGPEAEKLKDEYVVPEEYWIQICSRTKDRNDSSKGNQKRPVERTIDSFEEQHRPELYRFRNMLAAFNGCGTPTDIKLKFCDLIRNQKLHMINKRKFLATFIKNFCEGLPCLEKLKELCIKVNWNTKVDGTVEYFLTYYGVFEADDEFKQLVTRCQQIILASTLEKFCTQHKMKATPSILKALLCQLGVKVESVGPEDIVYINSILAEKAKLDGTTNEILKSLSEDNSDLTADFPLHRIPFNVFIREYDAMTSLPIEEQRFLCAVMYSVLLPIIDRPYQEATCLFPDVKHFSIAGGCASSRFLNEHLKSRVGREGRCFHRVPEGLGQDNAIMMGLLATETLKHLVKDAGECTCGDDQEAQCQSCELLRNRLYDHGCGALSAIIAKKDIAHTADQKWDAKAPEYLFWKPNTPPVYVEQAVSLKPDPEPQIQPGGMWDVFKSKNGNEGTPLYNFRALVTKWPHKSSSIEEWITRNQAVLEANFPNKTRRELIEKLLLTNFLGHGYPAFKAGKPESWGKLAYDPIADFEQLFKLLSPGVAAKP